MNCNINDTALKSIFNHCRDLRELRISQVDIIKTEITDNAFLGSPLSHTRYFEQLRLVDFTGITTITDMTLSILINAAPRIRSLVLNKCSGITDEGVLSICRLGKFLHFLHLGHCSQITDASITCLAVSCNRIRYLDMACCTEITDRSVVELSRNLLKLKRIGLVKCANITDIGLSALTSHVRIVSSLERIHLSYCARLSVRAIARLLNVCYRLNHLSLTHVPSFLRNDLQEFRRSPPKELTEIQRHAFCVYSGKGVQDLRDYLNTIYNTEDKNNTSAPCLSSISDNNMTHSIRNIDNTMTASTTPDITQEE
jgi:F-box and leucine-rich repeat protein GRR1